MVTDGDSERVAQLAIGREEYWRRRAELEPEVHTLRAAGGGRWNAGRANGGLVENADCGAGAAGYSAASHVMALLRRLHESHSSGMNQRTEFDPLRLLDALHAGAERDCAFTATGAAAARAWQAHAGPVLARHLGFLDRPAPPVEAELEQTVDRGSYVRERVVLRTWPDATMPVYVLVPKRLDGPAPCVLALHGHGYGVRDIVGLWEDGSERWEPDGYHKDFGCALAERGFVVVAPEISCFGERRADYSALADELAGTAPTTCHNAGTYASMLGGSVLGLRVWDGMRAVDYLATRPEADSARLGAMGISGGGAHAYFSTACDDRIRACVISGYFCDWRQSILTFHHCTCNFVPGLLRHGELSDFAGLIAPRPCLIEAGRRDTIFPIDGVRTTVERAKAAWRAFGAEDALVTDEFDGRHQISGRLAYDFLARHL